uniref:uncharacterized protein n=1 Tax=Centroberyx gerrardi TaxID=166262 RepID=UPI003AAB66D7
MASPRLSVLLCLTTLFFTLSCITAGAEESAPLSPRPADAGLVPQHRSKRQQPFPDGIRNKVDKSLQVATASLTVIKSVLDKVDTSQLTGILKGLASFASLAPGIGGLVASIVNVALSFVPQLSPMQKLKSQFDEVNHKLDSISQQIADLKTDVEWYNYASIYSQDETNILNSWNEFNSFRENCQSAWSAEGKLEFAAKFVSFYENTGTESSVANLYFYLTTREPSLSRNLMNLMVKKYKCDINDVGRYSLYFNSLLWKGMVLNQLYYKLKGYKADAKAAENVYQFEQVLKAQKDAVMSCADKYEYIEPAVREISKSLTLEVNTESATQIKEKLDEKYNSYNWIVVIFKTADQDNHQFERSTLVRFDEITIEAFWNPCRQHDCQNSATCVWLSGTVQRICECPRGFSGDRCEQRITVSAGDIEVILPQPVPSITTIDKKLTQLEAKIEEIKSICQRD